MGGLLRAGGGWSARNNFPCKTTLLNLGAIKAVKTTVSLAATRHCISV